MWLFRASPFASVRVVYYLESELSAIPRHPHPRLPGGRLKSRKYKKPPLAVKKVRLTPVEKLITLFLIGAIDNTSSAMLSSTNHTSRCFFTANGGLFERPKAAFLPWQLLSPCSAWRWGWWRRQGGKLVFHMASPPSPKRRSRQQPPWLFVSQPRNN